MQRRDDFHWVGPHATVAYVDQEMLEAGQEVVDGLAANATASDEALAVHAATPHGGGGTAFSIPALPDQDTPMADADLFGVWDASDGQTEKVPANVVRAYMQVGLAGGLQLSPDDPQPVGETAIVGDALTAPHANHGHALPIDNTLEFNASDELGVNVQDVIEHLQEHIQYFTHSSNYSSDAGATVGQAYATSQYRKIITKVEVLLNPLVGADAYLVRLDELNADNSIKAKLFTSNTRSAPFGLGVTARSFTFHDADGDVGVTIDGSIRLGILISRTGDDNDSAVAAIHGAEAGNSPRESYDDASVDFELENGVVYQHINPAIGAATHSHDTQIRGNIKIFYDLIIDHGNLVGNRRVNAAHLDSGSAALGTVATAQGDGTVLYAAPAGGGGGGGGGVNKVVSQIVTGTAPVSTTLGASGLSADITPSDDTKKVLIQVQGGYLDTGGASSDSYALRLIRGGNNILTPSSLRARNFDGPVAFTYLDSPASDVELTYSLNWAATEAGVGLEASATNPMVMILEELD